MEKETPPVPITEISAEEKGRFQIGIGEFDRVLGGGIVFGSMVLVGGDPGIGKSTLLLQVMHGLASSGRKVLYVSGEESLQQTKMRAERLGVCSDQLFLTSETSLEKILQDIQKLSPSTVVIDSIQTVYSSEFDDCLSAVDTETEAEILGNLRKVMQGRTTILISHRVSTVKDASHIIALKEGKIEEEGSHQQLMDKKGFYYELYQMQLTEDQKSVSGV